MTAKTCDDARSAHSPVSNRTPSPFELRGGRQLSFERVRVMGVVNVTPDSFSDGGRWLAADAAVAHGEALIAAGADLLDIGGESTRPGSDPVSADEQLSRILPVVTELAARGHIISVDTTDATVARAAWEAGATIINDISGFSFDPGMIPFLVASQAPAFAMHTPGPPKTMQEHIHYRDVVAEVRAALLQHLAAAVAAGVSPHQLGVDPGIGFGKRLEHNLALLGQLNALTALGHPVLVGPSRKAFLGALTGRSPSDRVMATAGAIGAAIALGAHVVRIHDVAELRDVVTVAAAIAQHR